MAIVLLAVLAAGVLALILSPVPIFGDQKRIYQLAIDLHEAGWPYWINFAFFERMANVVLFIPVGALLAATLPRRMQWLALILVLVLAAGLETAQLLLAERRSSILDVALNTLGGAIGVGVTAGIYTLGGAIGVGVTAGIRGIAAAVWRRRRHPRTAG